MAAQFAIRTYKDPGDRDGVVDLWRTVFGYEAAHNDPAVAISKKIAVNDGMFFVAEHEATIIGTVMAGYDGHRGWLYAVAVHPDWRRAGLGRALVGVAETALAATGCMKINLQLLASNAATLAFYESLGYAVEPRISMGKLLLANLPGADRD